MLKIGIFPGSFDPPTKGHIDIVEKGSKLCETLFVAVGNNSNKSKSLLTMNEKTILLKEITKNFSNVEIVSFEGLITDFARKIKAQCIIRGIRPFFDATHEFQMALANRKLGKLETIFLLSEEKYSHVSSTLIKEIASLGGELHEFVPAQVEKKLREKKN